MMSNNTGADRLLTREEAADFLKVRPQTLAAWASARRYDLPYVRVGSRARYRQSDLEKFVLARTVGGSNN